MIYEIDVGRFQRTTCLHKSQFKTAPEAHQMLKQAFREHVLGRSVTYDWLKRFKDGTTLVEVGPLSSRLSTGINLKNVAVVRNAIREAHPLRLYYCAAIVSTCQKIFLRGTEHENN